MLEGGGLRNNEERRLIIKFEDDLATPRRSRRVLKHIGLKSPHVSQVEAERSSIGWLTQASVLPEIWTSKLIASVK